MRILSSSTLLAGLGLSVALLTATPSLAEMMKMTATIDGAQEVPPVETSGKGTAELTFDTESKMLEWTVEYSGLTGPATAGHHHGPAAPGENAGVQVPFEGPLESPIKGSATLTDAQVADLSAGKLYVNLHTAANPNGEIRGQITKTGM